MIQYIETSIFHSPAKTITNPTNVIGPMGRGLALKFKHRYPQMFQQYQKLCREGQIEIGKLWLYKAEDFWILNFPTKQHYQNPSQPEYIEAGLAKFLSSYEEKAISSIAFPQLGCGLGGLSWKKDVQPIMEQYLGQIRIPVYIHIPPKP